MFYDYIMGDFFRAEHFNVLNRNATTEMLNARMALADAWRAIERTTPKQRDHYPYHLYSYEVEIENHKHRCGLLNRIIREYASIVDNLVEEEAHRSRS